MDLLSWTFNDGGFDQGKPVSIAIWCKKQTRLTDEQKLYIDANDASRWLSANQIREKVRQLISGFNHHGLGTGDCVCVVSFNDVGKNLSTLEKIDITWANFQKRFITQVSTWVSLDRELASLEQIQGTQHQSWSTTSEWLTRNSYWPN